MGSLMSGWNSRFQDPTKVKYMRNRSMTRVEIDAYWKSKKKTEKSTTSPNSASLPTTPRADTSRDHADTSRDYHDHHQSEAEKILFRRSLSMPMEHTSSKELHVAEYQLTTHDQSFDPLLIMKNSCWWTTSTWAFLNEPPVLMSNEPSDKHRTTSSYKYTPNKSHREAAASLLT